jgi:hypothetical protein
MKSSLVSTTVSSRSMRTCWGREMLEASHVYSFYGRSPVLQGVSLEVHAGEIVCLLGVQRCRQNDDPEDPHGPHRTPLGERALPGRRIGRPIALPHRPSRAELRRSGSVHLRRSHRRRKFGSRPLRPGRAVVQSRRLPHLPGTRSPADPLGPSPERGRAADTGHRASLEGQSVAPPMQCALRRPRTISGDASGHTAPRFGPAEAGRSSWQSNICALPLRWLTGATSSTKARSTMQARLPRCAAKRPSASISLSSPDVTQETSQRCSHGCRCRPAGGLLGTGTRARRRPSFIQEWLSTRQ